jgi:NADH:ubiquinone oxidoreductase subunit C
MRLFSISIVSLVLVIGFFVVPAGSSSLQQKTEFENIKVMTDVSDSDIMKAMRQWQDDLGTNCSYCHTGADFPAEDNPKKQTARVMYKLLQTINKDFLNGKASCGTCHHGATKPDPSAK